MKKAVKWSGMLFGVLLGVLILALGIVYGASEYHFRRSYDVQPAPLALLSDSATIRRGAHIATTRGCTDCHGKDMSGNIVIDAPPVAVLSGSNLTSGAGGVGDDYGAIDWIRAIRHGVGVDGKPLLFMPSHEFYPINDEDMSALVAFLESRPAVDHQVAKNSVGPIGRFLYLKGDLPLVPAELIDHDGARPDPIERAATAEYGEYLSTGCTGCHGAGFSGGKIPGTPPDFIPAANLTPDMATGIGGWTEEDFFRALREGRRPDGRSLNGAYMPWGSLGQMTDAELRAIWLHLRSLEPAPYGGR